MTLRTCSSAIASAGAGFSVGSQPDQPCRLRSSPNRCRRRCRTDDGGSPRCAGSSATSRRPATTDRRSGRRSDPNPSCSARPESSRCARCSRRACRRADTRRRRGRRRTSGRAPAVPSLRSGGRRSPSASRGSRSRRDGRRGRRSRRHRAFADRRRPRARAPSSRLRRDAPRPCRRPRRTRRRRSPPRCTAARRKTSGPAAPATISDLTKSRRFTLRTSSERRSARACHCRSSRALP